MDEIVTAPPQMHASSSPGFPLQRPNLSESLCHQASPDSLCWLAGYRRPHSARVRSIYSKQGIEESCLGATFDIEVKGCTTLLDRGSER